MATSGCVIVDSVFMCSLISHDGKFKCFNDTHLNVFLLYFDLVERNEIIQWDGYKALGIVNCNDVKQQESFLMGLCDVKKYRSLSEYEPSAAKPSNTTLYGK